VVHQKCKQKSYNKHQILNRLIYGIDDAVNGLGIMQRISSH